MLQESKTYKSVYMILFLKPFGRYIFPEKKNYNEETLLYYLSKVL